MLVRSGWTGPPAPACKLALAGTPHLHYKVVQGHLVLNNPHKNRELGEVLLTLQELSGTSTILPSNNFFNNFFVYFNDRQIFGGKTKNKSFA